MEVLPKIYRLTTSDGSDTLFHTAYDEPYHSRFGALTETEHVFLQATGMADRLAAGQATRILEVGFGTGLNFWATVRHARRGGATLHYVSLERDLLPAPLLAQLNHPDLLAEVADIQAAFVAWRASLPTVVDPTRLTWTFEAWLHLTLVIGDATVVSIPAAEPYHAVYHDAFSPDSNPELWTQTFFERLYPLLIDGGRVTTYSVKGTVRRNLQAVGFQVFKQPGPPGKREILVAQRP